MKILSLLLTCICLAPTILVAGETTPQDEIKSLKATVEEQRAALVSLREWVRVLDIRVKQVEEMKEVRVPRGIKNNLRILQAAVEQFCYEHKVKECQFSDLMGKYLSPTTFPIYDGERYESLRLALDAGEWRIDTSLGISIIHKLPKFDAGEFEKVTKGQPNQALLPTTTAVTPAASHPSRQP